MVRGGCTDADSIGQLLTVRNARQLPAKNMAKQPPKKEKLPPPYDWLDLLREITQSNQRELARMSAELDALTTTVNKLAADVEAVVTAYKTAKAHEADPAVLTQLNATLSGAATSIEAALNPPAA